VIDVIIIVIIITGWWFGTFSIFHILGRIIPTDVHFFPGSNDPTSVEWFFTPNKLAFHKNERIPGFTRNLVVEGPSNLAGQARPTFRYGLDHGKNGEVVTGCY